MPNRAALCVLNNTARLGGSGRRMPTATGAGVQTAEGGITLNRQGPAYRMTTRGSRRGPEASLTVLPERPTPAWALNVLRGFGALDLLFVAFGLYLIPSGLTAPGGFTRR